MSTWREQSSSDYTPSDPATRLNMLELLPPQPQPKTELARYRLLSPTAAVRVSPICLGTMSLGDQWTGLMAGKLDQAEGEAYLDAYYEAGGNFVDTAGQYHDEQSEHIIGEWMEKRGNRQDMVISTKYTSYGKNRKEGPYPGIGVNHCGNSKKNLRVSVEEALKRLRTDYIDVLYVHWWDHSTSIPELMQSLNELVRNGKVLYLGVSDTPAWVVAQANEFARQNCLAQFVIFQGRWSLAQRDMERDIVPMCRHNGMAIAPFAVLGQGKFKTPEELNARANLRGGRPPTKQDLQVCAVLQEVADEIGGGIHLAHIALAWVRQKTSHCIPVLGGTSIEQLKSNIAALSVELTEQQMKKLDAASPFDHGYPTGQFGLDPRTLPDQQPNNPLLTTAGHLQYPKWP